MFSWFKKKPAIPAAPPNDVQAALDELQAIQVAANEIHQRFIDEGRETAPEETDAWVAAGESGYVNCLLTVLAEGTIGTVTVAAGKRLPRLDILAGNSPSSRGWAERLRFPLETLSIEEILGILSQSFQIERARCGTLKTVLVRSDGAPLAVLFTANWLELGTILEVSVVRAP